MTSDPVSNFDINGPGLHDKIFGLPFTPEQAALVLLPVPWEVTVSYRTGTAHGPAAILKASQQIDLFFREDPDLWKQGMAMLPVPHGIQEQSNHFRSLAAAHIAALERGEATREFILEKINTECANMVVYVRNLAIQWLKQKKIIGLVGGDHSTPLGLMQALSLQYPAFGILHLDAHADLRKSYEGFQHSHGSIMYNALKLKAVRKIVQVGVRDYCQEEYNRIQESDGRIKTFFDQDMKDSLDTVKSWEGICREIVRELPDLVYISFDIDALDTSLCPHTGSPVPGGLTYHQAQMLLRMVAQKGKRIIGFDLVEVGYNAENDWDANVGARLLFELCHRTLMSQEE